MLTQTARVVDNTDSNQFDSDSILFLDVETSTHSKGNVYDPRNFLVSISDSVNGFSYYTDPNHQQRLQDVASHKRLVGFNIKFDVSWISRVVRGDEWLRYVEVWDCQLAEFILSGQTTPMQSLNEALESYGLQVKQDAVKEFWDAGVSTEDIPVEILEEYNNWDVEQTRKLYYKQLELLNDKQKALVLLQGEDLKTLAAAEAAGIRFDADESSKLLDSCRQSVMEAESTLSRYLPAIPVGAEFNWDSGDQLSAFLYGGAINYAVAEETPAVFQSGPNKGESYIRRKWSTIQVNFPQLFVPLEGSEVKKTVGDPEASTRFYQVDAPTLKQLKVKTKAHRQILDCLNTRGAQAKVAEMCTSLINKIKTMNWQDNYIHPTFNQNIAITGRLTSSNPNGQNTPEEIDGLLITRYV